VNFSKKYNPFFKTILNLGIGFSLFVLFSSVLMVFFYVKQAKSEQRLVHQKFHERMIEEKKEQLEESKFRRIAESFLKKSNSHEITVQQGGEILFSAKANSDSLKKRADRFCYSTKHILISSKVLRVRSCISYRYNYFYLLLPLIFLYLISFLFLKYIFSSIKKIEVSIVKYLSKFGIDVSQKNARMGSVFGSIDSLITKKELADKLELENKEHLVNQKIAKQIKHDLKAPLTTLKVLTHQISEKKHTRMLNLVANRIVDICSDLDFNNPKNIQLVQRISIEKCLNELFSQFKVSFTAISFTLNIHSQSDYCLQLDLKTFERIVANLIQNSIEAQATIIEIELSLQSKIFFLKVKDNGVGLINGIEIFEEGKSFRKKNGSGLGLFYCKEQILKWNGEITFSDTKKFSAGTCFTITLPIESID